MRNVRSSTNTKCPAEKKNKSDLEPPMASSSKEPQFLSVSQIFHQNTCTQVLVRCFFVAKKSKKGTIFCSCGKKLRGMPKLDDANARPVMEIGSRVIHALTPLRIRPRTLRCNRAGPSRASQDWNVMGIHWKRAVVKGVTVGNRKILYDRCADR